MPLCDIRINCCFIPGLNTKDFRLVDGVPRIILRSHEIQNQNNDSVPRDNGNQPQCHQARSPVANQVIIAFPMPKRVQDDRTDDHQGAKALPKVASPNAMSCSPIILISGRQSVGVV